MWRSAALTHAVQSNFERVKKELQWRIYARRYAPDNLYWSWQQGQATANFGDIVGLYLFEKITHRKPIYKVPDDKAIETVFMSVGSLLSHGRSNSIVWGSGIIRSTESFTKPYAVCAVRGPRTRRRFLELGYDCPDVFGDPALLLPRFYAPQIETRHEIGLIPHYLDYAGVKEAVRDERIQIINVLDPVETVIDSILSCRRTASTSLHGTIISHAYGVPSASIVLSDKMAGDGVKYADYYESVGLTKVALPRLEARELTYDALIDLVDRTEQPTIPGQMLDTLLVSCPFRNPRM